MYTSQADIFISRDELVERVVLVSTVIFLSAGRAWGRAALSFLTYYSYIINMIYYTIAYNSDNVNRI